MLDKGLGDGLAILYAGFVSRAPAEPLESLPLLQQGEGQAIGEIVGRGFYEVHALSQHGLGREAIR